MKRAKDNIPDERKALLIEAHRINYRLRSTFFYRKLNEYKTYKLPEVIKQLIPISSDYDWKNGDEIGISQDAYAIIEKSVLKPIQVFAHPRLLREHPNLISYYRNVAAMSQKGISYLVGISVEKFENGNAEELSETDAKTLAKLFNEHVSLIIESAIEGFDDEHIKGLLFASTGAQIDGSWRNAIGIEAEKVVQKMLIKEAIEKDLLSAFILRDDSKTSVELYDKKNSAKQLDRFTEFRGFTLNNKRSVLFSSEPDISILDVDGSTKAVLEIKGGTDPAGALERYGGAKKSFEESLRQNPQVTTVVLASCITSEVEKRIKSDKTISKYYNLTALLTRENERKSFLDYVFDTLLSG